MPRADAEVHRASKCSPVLTKRKQVQSLSVSILDSWTVACLCTGKGTGRQSVDFQGELMVEQPSEEVECALASLSSACVQTCDAY